MGVMAARRPTATAARVARALAAPSAAALLLLASSPAPASARAHAHRFLSPVAARVAHTHARAHAAIVGGTLTTIAQAPWQVAIMREGGFVCGGSIIDESRVLTAAVCVTEKAGKALPATTLQVLAGSSNIVTENEEDNAVEIRKVKTGGVRVHPFYKPAGALAPDDVAVLELEKPLKLELAAVQAIALPASPSNPAEGLPTMFTGYGEQNALTGELNGGLYSAAMTVAFPRPCGELADAVALCAGGGPGGASACGGDGGGPLVQQGETPTLIGVLVAIRSDCGAGSDAFANLAAPEIRDFIENVQPVPQAPRGPEPETASISGFLEPGHLLTCTAGVWTNAPRFTYTFLDSVHGSVLQTGESPAYVVTEADGGREISCEIHASNAGGTGVVRTKALPPIVAHPSRGGGTSTPASGGGAGAIGVLATTETRASPAQIEAALKAVLTPRGKAAKVGSLRRTHTYTVTFSAPEAGTVVIDWFEVPRGAHVTRARPILVAAGRAVFSAAGRAAVTIRLTSAGRALVRRGRAVKLTAKATFTSSHGGPVSARSTFTLGR